MIIRSKLFGTVPNFRVVSRKIYKKYDIISFEVNLHKKQIIKEQIINNNLVTCIIA